MSDGDWGLGDWRLGIGGWLGATLVVAQLGLAIGDWRLAIRD